jgi:hypothetical protein
MGSLDLDPKTWVTPNRPLDSALDLPPAERDRWVEGLAP